jgi:hypothetical protein
MPINEESKKRKEDFIDQLIKSGINLIEIPRTRGSLFKVQQQNVYIRTTTKENQKYWYDIPLYILNKTDYLIFQTTTKYHFTLFPSSFIKKIYSFLKDSNRPNTKIFYIDWFNDKGELLTSNNYSINISQYCCCTEKKQ